MERRRRIIIGEGGFIKVRPIVEEGELEFSMNPFEHPLNGNILQSVGYITGPWLLLLMMYNHYTFAPYSQGYETYLGFLSVIHLVGTAIQLLTNSYHAVKRRGLKRSTITFRTAITLLGFYLYINTGRLMLQEFDFSRLAIRISSVVLFNSAYELLFLSTRSISVFLAGAKVVALGILLLFPLMRLGAYLGYGLCFVAVAAGIESYFLRINTKRSEWHRQTPRKIVPAVLIILLVLTMQRYGEFFALRRILAEAPRNIESTSV
jgi:hypothetical protein